MQELSRASIRFPRTGHIWVPTASKRAAAAGISMYSPCRPAVVLGQRLLFAAIRVLGPSLLPGKRASWDDPVDTETWEAFRLEWREVFGPWDSVALYRRPQPERSGCALLLLRNGRGIGFVRITADHRRAIREFSTMSGVYAARPRTFRLARPVGHGIKNSWSWVGTESVPNYPLGAVRRESVRLRVIEELSGILDDVLYRSAETPESWTGSHGDLAPWNLRTEIGGAIRVIDWEDAGFAPPGTDILYGGITAHQTFGSGLPRSSNRDAIEWVATQLQRRKVKGENESSINDQLIELLNKVPVRK